VVAWRHQFSTSKKKSTCRWQRSQTVIRHALRADFSIEEIFNLTKIDRWFWVQIKEVVDFEEELAGAKN